MVIDLYRTFARNGALLNEADKQKLKDINLRLTDLYNTFNKNLLTANNAFEIVVDDKARLSGLPASSIAVAAEEAADRGYGEGKWVFTLHAPSRLPLLQYADDRELREQMYKGYNLTSFTAKQSVYVSGAYVYVKMARSQQKEATKREIHRE